MFTWDRQHTAPIHFILHAEHCTIHTTHLYCMLQIYHFTLPIVKVAWVGSWDGGGKMNHNIYKSLMHHLAALVLYIRLIINMIYLNDYKFSFRKSLHKNCSHGTVWKLLGFFSTFLSRPRGPESWRRQVPGAAPQPPGAPALSSLSDELNRPDELNRQDRPVRPDRLVRPVCQGLHLGLLMCELLGIPDSDQCDQWNLALIIAGWARSS